MSEKDKKHRKKFAQKMIKTHSPDVWQKEICFYLDGSSFVHKTNPADQARDPTPSYGENHVKVCCRAALLKDQKQEMVVVLHIFLFTFRLARV